MTLWGWEEAEVNQYLRANYEEILKRTFDGLGMSCLPKYSRDPDRDPTEKGEIVAIIVNHRDFSPGAGPVKKQKYKVIGREYTVSASSSNMKDIVLR